MAPNYVQRLFYMMIDVNIDQEMKDLYNYFKKL